MIEGWLDLPTIGVFATLTLFYAATAAATLWIAFGRRFAASTRRLDGVVAPFFTSVGLLFALLTSFLASDVGDRNRQAARAVQTEATELRNVYALSVAAASDMGAIRAAWSDYVRAVIADDWPAMERGEDAASVNAAYDSLLHEVSDPKITSEAGAAVHVALLNTAIRIGTARSERLAIAADHTNEIKWAMVLLLGALTQVSIGLVHLRNCRANIAALAVFSVATVVALGLIGLQEHPFAGDVRVWPAPLQDLLKLPASR
ncbi:MAG TPA: hypothetical protein VH558_17975 [Pseudolabrys sp.]|jgi:hypothetical protein